MRNVDFLFLKMLGCMMALYNITKYIFPQKKKRQLSFVGKKQYKNNPTIRISSAAIHFIPNHCE